MPAYKIIAVLLAYGALWQALSRWRVRAPERRLQLQLYGCVALLYVLMVAVTGGMSPSLLPTPLPPGIEAVCTQYVSGYFGSFALIFLLLGILEVAVSVGFYDPSLPLLSRWWVHAPFEGPGWRLLCRRAAGTPFTADEAEAMARHGVAGLVTLMSAFWAMHVAIGSLEWGRLDPVALVIFLKAINTW
ncbi:MAG: hypothetical protein LC772_06440, partial [Chloroflexi bacterium]|nr:hypothetical protein [Chloroflexota bacterium]